ncbi:MAG: phosphatase PAP2 family protein [Candidatus Altimarinota bacterium]
MSFISTLHNTINIPLLGYLNSFTDNEIISKIVYAMADMPIFILPIFLLGYWIYFNAKKNTDGKKKLLFIFYSVVIAITISTIIQTFVSIDRPESSLEGAGKLILEHIPDASFPSDHASVGIAFAVSLFLFGFSGIGYVTLPLFIVMLLSRVAGGVHWPLDIIAGSIVGIISSFLVYKSQNLTIFRKINEFVLKLASYFKL